MAYSDNPIGSKDDPLERNLRDAIERTCMEQAEPVILEAVAEFERKLRARVGEVAVGLLSSYQIDRQGSYLTIKVDIRQEQVRR